MLRGAFLLLCFVLLLNASGAGAAELVVINSTSDAFPPGRVFHDTDSLAIPAGQSVTLVSQSGQTLTVTGPHDGPAALPAGEGGDAGLVASLVGLLAGSGADTASIGVMRASSLPLPSDPWLLDVYRSGNFCIQPGQPVRVWRPKTDQGDILIIKQMRPTPAEGQVAWPQGVEVADWPGAVPLAEGAVYLLRLSSAKTARKVVVRLIPDELSSDAHRAAWMGAQDCKKQALALLARLR